VILTSGTLSPLDMYPKMLSFRPVVSRSLEMSIDRPCILPLVVARGTDQTPLSTAFARRDDPAVITTYGELLGSLCATVPDGVVAFFPSYAYMEQAVTTWSQSGLLRALEAHKLLYFETKDVEETSMALSLFKRACDAGRGALFFSIARGKVAEGIDFDRHYGRAVVIFGIPYQYTQSTT
jgi:DNA excision repair protein ERCC-2